MINRARHINGLVKGGLAAERHSFADSDKLLTPASVLRKENVWKIRNRFLREN